MTFTPMFPLEIAMLPGEELPLRIFEPRYSALVQTCLAAEVPVFGVVLIAAGREVGGGDERCDVGVLARIVEYAEQGAGRYRLRCAIGERIRVLEWLPDDPFPRAVTVPWPDESGAPVGADQLEDLEDRVMALFARIAAARGADLPPRHHLLGEPEPGESVADRLYTLASRIPIGQADRYAVLAAPDPAARLAVLREAVETVAAMVEFQLSGD
ncbi:LON peptidase substrate-binding domain-containing protein [Mycolicibacterium thermoresistibile]